MLLAPGTRLGPYEVVARIGAGGMGEVYRARDTRLDRTVAIKVLPEHLARDSERRQRFEREARALAALSHPHICAVFDVGTQEGIDYLVMEHLEGDTLAQRLAKGALAVDQAVRIAVEIADALDAAHRKGIIHRDLKPANVALTESGARLLDFGLARHRIEPEPANTAMDTAIPDVYRTSPGIVLGTVAYMAPEQARGHEADERTDLFALGVVIHEMATGTLPFAGATSAVIFDAILNHPPSGLERLPPDLAHVVRKALEKAPALRYQTAADAKADLLRLQRGAESGGAPAVKKTARASGARRRVESLAVLPLVSAGGDPDTEYLSEGIADGLINSLSQMKRLRVAPQQKSFRYRGDAVDLQQVARDLHVQAVVTGRVVSRGDTLVVKVTLVDAEHDAQIWGQQFTTKMADIFALQDDIVDQVLAALKVTLTGARAQKAVPARPATDVYHLYLKGRHHAAKRTPPNTQRALEFYKEALDLDPTFAAAYAGVADCYAHLGFTPNSTMAPGEAFPRAKAAAQKALALDGSLGDAYASLGMCSFLYDWDWASAERAFKRCLELTPTSLGARVWYPMLLAVIGRHDEALAEAKRAIDIDPLSANAAIVLAQVLFFARRFDAAEVAAREALELDPNYLTANVFLGFIHLARQEYDPAVSMLEKAVSIDPHHERIGTLALALGLAGRRDQAVDMLQRLTDLASRSYVSPFSLAEAHAGLRQTEPWRQAMAAALEARAGLLVFLDAEWWDTMRDDPYMAELRRKVGLPALL